MNSTPIRSNLVIAGQPSEEELRALGDLGYTAVVNLRRPGEPDQPIDPTAEGDLARSLGLDYLSVPVGGEPLADAQVEAVADALGRHAGGKVLLHCKQGGRAAGLALLAIAREEGWPAGEAIDRGRALGLELPPPIRSLVESYLGR